MKPSLSNVVRWSGLAALAAGIIFMVIQPIHPPDALSSVTTRGWVVIQSLKLAMCLLFIVGVTGLYLRQSGRMGWLGLAGFVAFAAAWALQVPYVFVNAYILPLLAAPAPAFVESYLGIVSGVPATMGLGALPTIYLVVGVLYLLGGLLFGIAVFRARVLPRWSGALLALGSVLPLGLTSFVGHPLDRYFAVPVGLALAWMGYALWSERSSAATEAVPDLLGPQVGRLGTE